MIDAARLLGNLIAFPSVSVNSNCEITDFLRGQIESLQPSEVEPIEYRDSTGERKACLLARWGQGQGGLAYFGHTDVVPATGWNGPGGEAFHAVTQDGKIFGRGACDMKGSVAMAVAAISRRAGSRFREPLYAAFTADEEVGYIGARQVVAQSRLYREMVQGQPRTIVGEPTRLRVVHGHKGTVLWKVVARGRAAHSSTGRGSNANLQMIPFLAELKKIHDKVEGSPEWRDSRFTPSSLTMNIGVNDHTTAINITPARSTCTIYLRPAPGMNLTPLQDLIRSAAEDFGLEFLVEHGGSPTWIEPDDPLVVELLEMLGQPTSATVCYGTDACELSELQRKVIWGPGDIAQAHTDSEWIELEQLNQGVELFGAMIDRWCVQP